MLVFAASIRIHHGRTVHRRRRRPLLTEQQLHGAEHVSRAGRDRPSDSGRGRAAEREDQVKGVFDLACTLQSGGSESSYRDST